eukprot:764614-Hanusia_phi.AAC.3
MRSDKEKRKKRGEERRRGEDRRGGQDRTGQDRTGGEKDRSGENGGKVEQKRCEEGSITFFLVDYWADGRNKRNKKLKRRS